MNTENVTSVMNQEVSPSTAIQITGIIIQIVLLLSIVLILSGSNIGEPVSQDNTPYMEYLHNHELTSK